MKDIYYDKEKKYVVDLTNVVFAEINTVPVTIRSDTYFVNITLWNGTNFNINFGNDKEKAQNLLDIINKALEEKYMAKYTNDLSGGIKLL